MSEPVVITPEEARRLAQSCQRCGGSRKVWDLYTDPKNPVQVECLVCRDAWTIAEGKGMVAKSGVWSQERPASAGWYWFSEQGYLPPKVVNLFQHPTLGLFCVHFSYPDHAVLLTRCAGLWQRIEEPTQP